MKVPHSQPPTATSPAPLGASQPNAAAAREPHSLGAPERSASVQPKTERVNPKNKSLSFCK